MQAVLAAGAGRDVLSYRTLKVLADLDPAVAEVRGYTRYGSTVTRSRSSIAAASRATCRAESNAAQRCAAPSTGWPPNARCWSAIGRSDGRTLVFVPEVKGGETTGITLLHVAFHDRLPADVMRGVLQGYDRRYDRLVDWVSETEGSFDETLLGELSVARTADRTDLRHRRPLAPADATMIGIGIDLVDIERFRRSLERTPSMRTRLFTEVELAYVAPQVDPVPSLAARFAAREAVMKSLGVGLGAFGFHEVWVERAESGRPSLAFTGRAAELAAAAGVVTLASVADAQRSDGSGLRDRRVRADARRHRPADIAPQTSPRRHRPMRSSQAGAANMLAMIEEFQEAWDELTAPGAQFATTEIEVRGVPDHGVRGAPPSMRIVWELARATATATTSSTKTSGTPTPRPTRSSGPWRRHLVRRPRRAAGRPRRARDAQLPRVGVRLLGDRVDRCRRASG